MPSRALNAQEQSWLELARRVLTPARPRLAEVLAAAGEYPDDAALLEALAARGVVPSSWLDDPSARFGKPLERGLVVALACDPEAVVRAEALAAECASRCLAWGAKPAKGAARWRLLPRDAKRPPRAAALPASLESRIAEEVFAHWVERDKGMIVRSVERAARAVSGRRSDDHGTGNPAVAPGDPPWRARMWDGAMPGDSFLRNLSAAEVWKLLAARGFGVAHTPRGAREKIKGRPYSAMPSPFEALVELWGTGFYVTKLEGALELVAPEP